MCRVHTYAVVNWSLLGLLLFIGEEASHVQKSWLKHFHLQQALLNKVTKMHNEFEQCMNLPLASLKIGWEMFKHMQPWFFSYTIFTPTLNSSISLHYNIYRMYSIIINSSISLFIISYITCTHEYLKCIHLNDTLYQLSLLFFIISYHLVYLYCFFSIYL